MMKKAFVLGSINMDLCLRVDTLPMVGESKRAHGFFATQGGKGANQSIAVKKLGLDEVYFIGSVGKDNYGKELKESLSQYGIDLRGLKETEVKPTGVCVAVFDETINDNMLFIDAGANEAVDKNFVKQLLKEKGKEGDIFITQLETNLDAVYEGIKTANEMGMYVILNPAPVTKIDESIYKYIDLIIPNETETKLLTGVEVINEISAKKAFEFFNVPEMVITLGKDGGYYINKNTIKKYNAHKCKAIDTTCAGDTFIGALAIKKAEGFEIIDSLDFASKCSAITVSRKGAGISIPTKEEAMTINE